MRLIVVDEDIQSMPELCDLLKLDGHEVLQVSDWKKLKATLFDFKPEGIILDMMMPIPELPIEECSGGFTSGNYLYKEIISKAAPTTPFIILSGANIEIEFIDKAINELRHFKTFKGVLEKPGDEEIIIKMLSSDR